MPDTPSKRSNVRFPQLAKDTHIGLGTSREQSFRISRRIRFRMTPKETIRERPNVLQQNIFSWLTTQVSRTGLRAQFPDNREKYREFRKIYVPTAPEVPNSVDAMGNFDPIPCVPEQGILKR